MCYGYPEVRKASDLLQCERGGPAHGEEDITLPVLWFMVYGLWFMVYGLGFRGQGSGFRD